MPTIKLSVIIVNYNVKHFLEQCLNSVVRAMQKAEGGVEVTVVDNNSVDGSVLMVREKFPGVKIISNNSNNGFAKANNQGIAVSSGEYILLLNPDCIVEEDTFLKTVRFMEEHPGAGMLGVKMIDGKGEFLPESKRSLPLPSVAFYKISGLAKLFPRSKTFARYHLGYLDKNVAHEVEVLSGAFMMIRNRALKKTGPLDEDYFMYGEDIDISYRMTKAGFINYYYPGTTIIHYKGESTRRGSINYVRAFYGAMLIFTKKHFSGSQATAMNLLIRLAIYMRASAALLHRVVNTVLFPAGEFATIYCGAFLATKYWEKNVKSGSEGYYPDEFFLYELPVYVLAWVTGIYFGGGYDRKRSMPKILQGIAIATVFILSGYALLPETVRYSRAIILLGAAWTTLFASVIRVIIHLFRNNSVSFSLETKKRIAIAGEKDEGGRVAALLSQSGVPVSFIGLVHPQTAPGAVGAEFIGRLDQLEEVTRIYKIDEIIFCARDIPSQEIISRMAQLNNPSLQYKIAPPESLFIIGSNSSGKSGEYYTVEINSITSKTNTRNKRLFDIAVSLFMIPFIPILIFMARNPIGLIRNIGNVLLGARTWVGYSAGSKKSLLPEIRPGILQPADRLGKIPVSGENIQRMDFLYAKDYHVWNDLEILVKGIRKTST